MGTCLESSSKTKRDSEPGGQQARRRVVESEVRRGQGGLIGLWISCKCVGSTGEALRAGRDKIRWWAEGSNTGILPFSLAGATLLLSLDLVRCLGHSSRLPGLQRRLSSLEPSFMLCFLPGCCLTMLLMVESPQLSGLHLNFTYSRS